MSRQRFRNICFTAWCENIEYDTEYMTYLIVGKEICPSTGKEHFQGYCELKRQTDFSVVKRLLGGDATHLEKRRGSAKQASSYCKKENDFIEYGELSTQGKRKDLEDVVEDIQQGTSIRDVALGHPVEYIKYHRGIEKLRNFMIEPRNWITNVHCLYGKTGTGKSKLAREMCETPPYVWYPHYEKWFNGYDGQECVIFEEYRGQFPLGELLSLTDRYSTQVQTKGGMVEFAPKKIIFTSPKHPKDWYENCGSDKIDQLLRRVSDVSEVAG